jgi:hypothetical protein
MNILSRIRYRALELQVLSDGLSRRRALYRAMKEIGTGELVKPNAAPSPKPVTMTTDPAPAGSAREALFAKLTSMHHAMKAAAREVAKAKAAAAPVAPSLPVELPPSAKAAPARPAASAPIEESVESMVAGTLARLYAGTGGQNINHEFPPDAVRENWLATQNQPAPSKATDAEFLHPLDQKAVAAAFEQQQAKNRQIFSNRSFSGLAGRYS